MQEIILKIRYFERKSSKSLKQLNLFIFWTQSLLMENIMKNKKVQELVTSSFSGYKTDSKKFLC